jgi:hypothetical protein
MKEAEMAEERRRREEALRREKERIEAELREREMEELAVSDLCGRGGEAEAGTGTCYVVFTLESHMP